MLQTRHAAAKSMRAEPAAAARLANRWSWRHRAETRGQECKSSA